MKIENVLVFRTSIAKKQDIRRIRILFSLYPRISKWSVDFEDWEKVLRVECAGIAAAEIIDALRAIDIHASELE